MADKKFEGFSKEEQLAMKNRAKELLAESKAGKKREAVEKILLDAIAEMKGADKEIATKLHEIMSKHAPELWPKTWYGFPAYTKNDKVVCFFQFAGKFDSRYGTLGFNDTAKLDQGNMWPTAFAITKIGAEEEKKIIELVKKAIS